MFWIFLATFIICYIILKYYEWKKSVSWCKALPEMHQFSVMDSVKLVFASRTVRLQMQTEYLKKEPRICYAMFGPIPKVMVNHPDLIKQVLLSPDCLQKVSFYRFFGWGNGLATADAKVWKIHRKLLNPAFSTKMLQSFIPIFSEVSREFSEILEGHLNKSEFDILDYAVKATLDSICETSFGLKVEAQAKNIDFNRYLQRTHEIISLRIYGPIYQPDLFFRLTRFYKEDKCVRDKCMEFGKGLIKRRRDIIQNEENTQETVGDGEYFKKPQIFVDQLLKMSDLEGKFTESEIHDHVFTIISAGNETTALAVSFSVLFMAIHQNVQEKVINEIYKVFGSDKLEIDYDKLCKLNYMEMVIKETLRLSPSVPNIAREPTKDIELDGFHIPKGAELLIPIITTMRRKDIWGENPLDFDPNRFLPENIDKRHPYAWMPFSLGVRNCIGYKYAMMSLKIMLTHLLWNYNFTSPLTWKDVQWKLDIHIHLTKPHWVAIQKRNTS